MTERPAPAKGDTERHDPDKSELEQDSKDGLNSDLEGHLNLNSAQENGWKEDSEGDRRIVGRSVKKPTDGSKTAATV